LAFTFAQFGRRRDAPIPAADPVDDETAVFLRRLLPHEVTRVERMDLRWRAVYARRTR